MKLISVPKWWNARWNARNRLKSANKSSKWRFNKTGNACVPRSNKRVKGGIKKAVTNYETLTDKKQDARAIIEGFW
jgi:hypothetical protein